MIHMLVLAFAAGQAPEPCGMIRQSPMATASSPPPADPTADVAAALTWLRKRGTRANRDGMARYAIVAPQVFGVSVADIRRLGKTLGPRHDLAEPLWASGWYEARMLVAFVADPARVTPAQMDRWTRDFDNWAICDTLSFHLFDRSRHAWRKVDRWATRDGEFVKRAAFALLAALALHDRDTGDEAFLERLDRIEAAAADPRNFVKKGVSWALRSIGSRNVALHAAAIALAERLATSTVASVRWVGKDTLRDLQRPLIVARVAKKTAAKLAGVRRRVSVRR
jgi:3-methyladenine DNA glycosylase AlkD